MTTTGIPLHVGRTFVVVQTDIRDEEARHIAQVTQTQAVITAPSYPTLEEVAFERG